MARLDRLPQVRELAQLGSVLGREFAYEMISGLSTGGETILQKGLEQLVDAELLYQRGRPPRAKYIFKHALIRDAAYGSLLRRTREQYHLQVATLIESRFPDTIESHPELIAHHYFEAGESELAIDYFQKAGARAMLTSANQEAIAHLTKGLEILDTMSENPERDQQELSLLMAIGPALIATKGYAASEVEPAYFRALEICRKLGEAEKEFSVVLGLSLYFFVKAELPKSKELSHQLVELAKGREDPGPDLSADRALGYAMGFMGDLEESRELMDRVAASYDYDKHGTYAFRHGGSDFGVGALGSSAWIYFALGYPDQAKDRGKRSVALAQKLNHPISEAAALFFLSVYYTLTGEFNLAHEHSRETLKIAEERGFVQYVAWGGIVHNSSLFAQDGSEAAIDGMREAIQLNRKIGSNLFIPYWNILLVRALAKKDQVNEGLHLIEETIAEINISKERIWEAELYRVKGQLLLKNDEGNAPEAENCFRKSIDIAQSQSAKGWELRAATGLARLWQSQEKTDEARDLLKPVYDWFTEGFDTDDLRKAKTVLVELA